MVNGSAQSVNEDFASPQRDSHPHQNTMVIAGACRRRACEPVSRQPADARRMVQGAEHPR